MPQESAEAWVGRMAKPIQEWYAVLKDSYPGKVRTVVCVAAATAVLSSGAGIVEGVFLHHGPTIPTEDSREAKAAAADRVGFEFTVAGGAAATGAVIMLASALHAGRSRDQ